VALRTGHTPLAIAVSFKCLEPLKLLKEMFDSRHCGCLRRIAMINKLRRTLFESGTFFASKSIDHKVAFSVACRISLARSPIHRLLPMYNSQLQVIFASEGMNNG
jgi:hypothetical protein